MTHQSIPFNNSKVRESYSSISGPSNSCSPLHHLHLLEMKKKLRELHLRWMGLFQGIFAFNHEQCYTAHYILVQTFALRSDFNSIDFFSYNHHKV